MSQRIYNTTDGPLIIDDEGHVLASREHARVKSLDDEPIAGHLAAGRLLDTTPEPEPSEDDKPKPGDKAKPTPPTPRS